MPVVENADTLTNKQGRIRSTLASIATASVALPQVWPSESNTRQDGGATINANTVRNNLITLMGTQSADNIANVDDWIERGSGATQWWGTP